MDPWAMVYGLSTFPNNYFPITQKHELKKKIYTKHDADRSRDDLAAVRNSS